MEVTKLNDFLNGKLDYSSSLTLQDQIFQILKNNIDIHQLEVGYKLPTEEEICKAYDISRSTVRGAIQELEKDGLVARVRGKGTFISSGKIERKMEKVYSFSHQMEASNKKPSSMVLEFKQVEVTPKLAKIFGLPIGQMLFLIKRIRCADQMPMLVETTYLPVAIYPQLTEESVAKKSLYDTLRREANVIPYIAEEVYESVIMNADICKLMKCPKGSSGFHIERIARVKSGAVYEFTQSYMRGDCNKISITLKEDTYSFSKDIIS